MKALPANPAALGNLGYRSPVYDTPLLMDHVLEVCASWFGPETPMRRLGSGSYGTVFAVQATPRMKASFAPIFASRDFLQRFGTVTTLPPVVAVKVVFMPHGTNDRGSYMAMLREMRTHWALCHFPPKFLGGKVYDIASVIPRLYAAGYDRRARAAVFFMEYMHGSSIQTMARPPFPPLVLARIEYALACLFLNGFLHVDFHPGNIFYDPRTGGVKIFDFAFAATLQPGFVHRFRMYLQTHGVHALAAFWRDVGEMQGDAAVMARHRAFAGPIEWYRNISVLDMLQRMVPNAAALNAFRLMVWVPAQIDPRYFAIYTRRHRMIV